MFCNKHSVKRYFSTRIKMTSDIPSEKSEVDPFRSKVDEIKKSIQNGEPICSLIEKAEQKIDTWLHILCRDHEFETVELWFSNHATPEEKEGVRTLYDDNERNPLLVVFERDGDRKVISNFIQLFEKMECSITNLDRKSWNALHIACNAHAFNAVAAIYERTLVSKVDKKIVAQRTNKGYNPIRVAVESSCMDSKIFLILFQMGVFLYDRDNEKLNIFEICQNMINEQPDHPFIKSSRTAASVFDDLSRNIATQKAITELLRLKEEDELNNKDVDDDNKQSTFAASAVLTRTLCETDEGLLYMLNDHEKSKCIVTNTRITAQTNRNGVDKVSVIFVVSPFDVGTFIPPQEVVVAIVNDSDVFEKSGIHDFPNLYAMLNMEEITLAVNEQKEYDHEPVILTADNTHWDITVQSIVPHNYLLSKMVPDINFWTKVGAEAQLEKEEEQESPDPEKINIIKDVIDETNDEMKNNEIKFTTLFFNVTMTIHLTRPHVKKETK